MKKLLGQVFLLLKPYAGKPFQLYLVVTDEAINSILVKTEWDHQLPIYYVSKALLQAKTRNPDVEKLTLAFVTTSRKLRPYFQAHTIHILTNFPLKQVIQKPDTSERLMKWL